MVSRSCKRVVCVGDSLERGCVDVKVGGDWRDYRVLVSMVVSGVEARHDQQSPKPKPTYLASLAGMMSIASGRDS